MIDGGGGFALGAAPPGKAGWSIAIANAATISNSAQPSAPGPASQPVAQLALLQLHDCGIATSGDAEQYVEIGGKRYSHIVDPKTGIGLTTRCQVTVIAPDGTAADALTKPVCVLGPEKGFAIIDKIDGVAGRYSRITEAGVAEVHRIGAVEGAEADSTRREVGQRNSTWRFISAVPSPPR